MGKVQFHGALSAFVGSSVSPVVEDPVGQPTWTSWGANQRDFFIVGPGGELIHRVNLTPGFVQADIDGIVQAALAELPDGSASSCTGDVNGDGAVDVNDLLEVLSAFGQSGELPADVTGDSLVDGTCSSSSCFALRSPKRLKEAVRCCDSQRPAAGSRPFLVLLFARLLTPWPFPCSCSARTDRRAVAPAQLVHWVMIAAARSGTIVVPAARRCAERQTQIFATRCATPSSSARAASASTTRPVPARTALAADRTGMPVPLLRNA